MTVSSPRRRALEIAWAVLPGVALAVVLVFTWRAIHGAPGAARQAGDSIVATDIR